MKSMFQILATVACALALTACGGGAKTTTAPVVAQPAFKTTDTVAGTGLVAATGDLLSVHYTGWLYDSTKSDLKGDKFDSSLDRGVPFSFTLGVGSVITGWDQGLVGMQVGGKRTLVIPATLAYGPTARAASSSSYAAIPANSPLVFEVQLLSVTKPIPSTPVPPPPTLLTQDNLVGTGTAVAAGKTVTVKYTGYIYDGSKSDLKGGIFDSSLLNGANAAGTYDFVLASGNSIAGWDLGIAGMLVGGKRTLIIPPSLGYGSVAQPSHTTTNGYAFVGIPSNSTLIFEVEVTAVN